MKPLSINQIKHQDSAFYLFPRKKVQDDFLLEQSLSELGFLQPLLVYQEKPEGAYHLLDGYCRLAVAKKLALTTVPCQILPHETSLTRLFELLLISHYATIQANLIGRVHFIALALARGMERFVLCKVFLPRLNLEGHEKVLRQCEAISRLPEAVLDFCREKNFSMRQCLALTRQPEALLRQVMAWREQLSLTASIIEELLTLMKDLLRIRDQDISTFLASSEISEILNSDFDLSKQEKTRLLRRLIKNWRYPILSQAQENLQRIYQQMPLPEQSHLKWDESLERKELILQLVVRDVEEWRVRVAGLQDKAVIEGVERLLGQL